MGQISSIGGSHDFIGIYQPSHDHAWLPNRDGYTSDAYLEFYKNVAIHLGEDSVEHQ